MRFMFATLAAGFSLAAAGSAHAADLVTNGTFSAGATGYSTTYTGTDAAGYQYLSTNPRNICGCFANIDGTTNGHGNQLILDGAAAPGGYFFQQTFAIAAGSSYTFSFDAVNLGTAGPQPVIAALVNGVSLFTTGALSYDDVYRTYSGVFNSGGATSATITLTDLTLDHSYNDFAIDNVAFVGPAAAAAVPEPAVWSMMILGMGATGVAMRRRRKITARVSFAA